MVSYDHCYVFSLVRALKSGRLSCYCTWTCFDLSHKHPLLPSFSHSELFVIVSSWKLFKVGIQSVLLPLFLEKIPFPLYFVCTFLLFALLWYFQPCVLWHFVDITLCFFISIAGMLLFSVWSLHPWRGCYGPLLSTAQWGDILQTCRVLNEDVSRADQFGITEFLPD